MAPLWDAVTTFPALVQSHPAEVLAWIGGLLVCAGIVLANTDSDDDTNNRIEW